MNKSYKWVILFYQKSAKTKTRENFSNLNIKDKSTNSFQAPYEFKCVEALLSENTKLIALT